MKIYVGADICVALYELFTSAPNFCGQPHTSSALTIVYEAAGTHWIEYPVSSRVRKNAFNKRKFYLKI
jgi:hypothetical protein